MKTQEAREKALATKKAKAEQFSKQVFQVDDDWRIQRFDELNWAIWKKGRKEPWYYPDVISAFKALPSKLLDQTAKTNLAQLIQEQSRVSSLIESALNIKLA